MLSITRKVEESVILMLPDGTEIEVLVCGVHYGRVKLAFAAPRNVLIRRREILEREERKRA